MKAFSSKFVKGKTRGRLFGFPTINFDVAKAPKSLEFGVYGCEVFIDGTWYKGVAHYGKNATFGEKEPSFEVHLLRYHRSISKAGGGFVRLFEKIREAGMKFENVNELKKQIESDILKVKEFGTY